MFSNKDEQMEYDYWLMGSYAEHLKNRSKMNHIRYIKNEIIREKILKFIRRMRGVRC